MNNNNNSIVIADNKQFLAPAVGLSEALARYQNMKEFVSRVLVKA